MKQHRVPFRYALHLLIAAVTLLPVFLQARNSSPLYTFQMFRAGLDERSIVTSAPHFLLIKLQTGPQKTVRVICVPGSALQHAIHVEYTIPFDARGINKVREIARANWDKPFVFRNKEASESVQPRYTEQMLSSARDQLQQISSTGKSITMHQLKHLEELIDRRIERGEDADKVSACRDALAHALLERGILARVNDVTGGLSIESPRSQN